MKNNFKILTLSILLLAGVSSCTDLEIEETDSIISDGFQGLADPTSTVTNLYGTLAGQYATQENYFALQEVTTDEHLIPTRGGDWGDNGLWRVMHTHDWDGQHTFIVNLFQDWNGNQLQASQVLDPRSNPSATNIGDASFIRAYSMWVILDNYGQVPYRDTSLPSSSVPEVLTGQAAVDFILADLETAIANAPTTAAGSGDGNLRTSKAAARYLKAKVLLNKHIYIGGSPDSADMNEVISLVDAISADGYALQDGYFDLFLPDADNETIWALEANTINKIVMGLHYNSTSIQGGGWNGFSTLAEFYDLFEGDSESNELDADQNPVDGQEERRGGVPTIGTTFAGQPYAADNGGFVDGSNVGYGFLINQQYALDGTPLNDRQGAPLTFKRDFEDGDGNTNFINNDETTGIRVQKYAARNGDASLSHQIVFRYADAHLMKAEAMFRNGEDPTTMINELRTIRNTQELFGTVTEQDILDERGRELYQEAWRRNDLIRFGQFGRDWLFKAEGTINNDDYNVFPIPPAQLLANPNLVQNPGY
ncbi:RagB/SusD family nutrient uptake outer membrane protein [Maribacter sp.]|uniref:RagB/SusD family nutrient uptake outer membrane protein n=1 Tax=Maribacter sp. TaxID=1897614 RepID=UPI0032989080